MKFAVGQPVTRIEDTRLITGEGKFTDDLKLPNMVYGVFLRSPYAHANITGIDYEEALKMPGVVDIFTGDRLQSEGLSHMSVIDFLQNKDGTPMNASKDQFWQLVRLGMWVIQLFLFWLKQLTKPWMHLN